MSAFPYNRIVVIGTTSSGKSTLAEAISKRLGMDFVELDALHWEPDWKEAPLEVFRSRVEETIRTKKWVVAGNYHVVRDLIWPKAEAVIWLDYPLWIIFWQLTRRTFKRWWTQELLWGTNRDLLWTHFKLWSQESLFHWLFKTYWRRKRETPELLKLPEHRHLRLFRFTHPKETEEWIKGFDMKNSLDIEFKKMTQPTPEIASSFSKWENDPELIPLTRPNLDEADLLSRRPVTVDDLLERLRHSHLYLIYAGGELVGEMDYKVDPAYVYKKVEGTAWIGITIGEESGRGKGIGYQALLYLERQIKLAGLKRIELGVFEFNTHAVKLYQKAGYKEIARIEGFTYWQGKMWQDIRMEKYL